MRAWQTVLLCAAVSASGPSGAVEVERPSTDTDAGTRITLRDASARATLDLADGSTLRLVGPAALRIVEVTATGVRVELVSGTVSDARVRGVPVEIQSGYGASLVLQNARGYARVVVGETVTFHRRSGEYARVHHGERTYDLGSNSWRLHVLPTTDTGPVPKNAGTAGFSRN